MSIANYFSPSPASINSLHELALEAELTLFIAMGIEEDLVNSCSHSHVACVMV
jgi:hypothetical protein